MAVFERWGDATSPLLAEYDGTVIDIGEDHIAIGEPAVEHVEAERI
jgi:hypothetical protein